MKKLNWGIIGSGVIANEMAQALLDGNVTQRHQQKAA